MELSPAELFTLENGAALVTLTAMELVLGVDNIVVLAIVTGKLPPEKQRKARLIGLSGALILRVALLFTLTAMMKLTTPIIRIFNHPFSGRDIILLAGGFFLIGKGTYEIHEKVEISSSKEALKLKTRASMVGAITQIMLLDMVFSLDSIVTAVGMARNIVVMIGAIIFAIIGMMTFAGVVSAFIDSHPTIKILALSFLILIGVLLVAEGFGKEIERGYVYFAMVFSLFVELINMKVRMSDKSR